MNSCNLKNLLIKIVTKNLDLKYDYQIPKIYFKNKTLDQGKQERKLPNHLLNTNSLKTSNQRLHFTLINLQVKQRPKFEKSEMAKDYLGKDMRKGDSKVGDEKEEKEIKSLDEGDIALLKSYGQGQYSKALKQVLF